MNKEAGPHYRVAEHQHKTLEIICCPILQKSKRSTSEYCKRQQHASKPQLSITHKGEVRITCPASKRHLYAWEHSQINSQEGGKNHLINSRCSIQKLVMFKKRQEFTWSMKATTSTVMKRVVVSKSWKLRSISVPISHPMTTQNGICKQQSFKFINTNLT
jgi:uncharacterized protein YbaR (Trm112 family)